MPGTLLEEILEEAGISVADALALWGTGTHCWSKGYE
jgi:hypothetical protein